jgi:WhiB family redox-sensing transcriptional regulator
MHDLPVNKNILHNISWMDDASCKGLTDIFFGRYAERPQATVRREARAKSVCDKCPVFDKCRQYARANMEVGYWAGENEYDRYIAVGTKRIPSKYARGLKAYIKRQNLTKEEQNDQSTNLQETEEE